MSFTDLKRAFGDDFNFNELDDDFSGLNRFGRLKMVEDSIKTESFRVVSKEPTFVEVSHSLTKSSEENRPSEAEKMMAEMCRPCSKCTHRNYGTYDNTCIYCDDTHSCFSEGR